MTPKSQKTSQKMVGLEGFEPPTHGLGILYRMLILNKIKNLTRQNPNKYGKFRNLGATKILMMTAAIRPETKIRKGANHEPLRPRLSHASEGPPRLFRRGSHQVSTLGHGNHKTQGQEAGCHRSCQSSRRQQGTTRLQRPTFRSLRDSRPPATQAFTGILSAER
jgi:hypothetical protein